MSRIVPQRFFNRSRRRWGDDEILVFAGTASPRLTASICRHLELERAEGEVIRFSEGTLFVRVLENVRGRNVYVVQSTVFPTSDNFMELLFWIDAFRRASAASITAVIPYFSYGKGDKKDEPRVSIRARVCADAIEAAGADRVVVPGIHRTSPARDQSRAASANMRRTGQTVHAVARCVYWKNPLVTHHLAWA
jgi:ribose-phosphate pyrophosphokinase